MFSFRLPLLFSLYSAIPLSCSVLVIRDERMLSEVFAAIGTRGTHSFRGHLRTYPLVFTKSRVEVTVTSGSRHLTTKTWASSAQVFALNGSKRLTGCQSERSVTESNAGKQHPQPQQSEGALENFGQTLVTPFTQKLPDQGTNELAWPYLALPRVS